MRWLRTFARNWRESAPYVPAMWTGFGGRVGLRFSLRETLQGAAFELGRGVAAGYDVPERQRLEKELEALRVHARVHEDQWRLTNEDLRRSRVCQRQAEEYALELKAQRDQLAADVRSFTQRARRWYSWR
jgi:hypothetical protein